MLVWAREHDTIGRDHGRDTITDYLGMNNIDTRKCDASCTSWQLMSRHLLQRRSSIRSILLTEIWFSNNEWTGGGVEDNFD